MLKNKILFLTVYIILGLAEKTFAMDKDEITEEGITKIREQKAPSIKQLKKVSNDTLGWVRSRRC